MKVDLPCFHSRGCHDKTHKVKFDMPDICGVLDCNREAKTKIRQGLTYYKVCMLHAQGFDEVIMENKNYGS